MVTLLTVVPLSGCLLRLEYDDGTAGVVDLSPLIGKGVFATLKDRTVFDSFSVGEHGEVRWSDELELCADALYLQVTGKSVEELFPDVKDHADA